MTDKLETLAIHAAINPDAYDVLEDYLLEIGWKRQHHLALTPDDDLRNVNARAYMAAAICWSWGRHWPVVQGLFWRERELLSGLQSGIAMARQNDLMAQQAALQGQMTVSERMMLMAAARANLASLASHAPVNPTRGEQWDRMNDMAQHSYQIRLGQKK